MFWDYHVLLVYAGRVYDFDTTLPWGCAALEYCTRAIRPTVEFKGADTAYEPRFRIVPLHEYLRYFASDRSHMPAYPVGADGEGEGGEEGAGTPHPTWPLLRGPEAASGMTLPRYWTMTATATATATTVKEGQRAEGGRGHGGQGAGEAEAEAEAEGPHYGEVCSRAAFHAWCAEQVQRWP
jgi:hypothetical protein